MIFRIGDTVFKEYYLCFQFARKSFRDAWRVVGIYMTCRGYTACALVPELEHYKKEFKEECAAAGELAGTHEFMDRWRKNHVDPFCVIAKPIIYCHYLMNSLDVFKRLVKRFLGTMKPQQFFNLAHMLGSEGRCFSVVYFAEGSRVENFDLIKLMREQKIL